MELGGLASPGNPRKYPKAGFPASISTSGAPELAPSNSSTLLSSVSTCPSSLRT